MKTIKIIDLLNKIANGEEAPKKIRYKGHIYQYQYKEVKEANIINYYHSEETHHHLIDGGWHDIRLNDEVEIIEENKLPEKLEEIGKIDYNLGYIDYKDIEVLKNWLNKDIQSILNELDLIVKNQNQLIDYLESKEKGE